jgi:hypothetical protein
MVAVEAVQTFGKKVRSGGGGGVCREEEERAVRVLCSAFRGGRSGQAGWDGSGTRSLAACGQAVGAASEGGGGRRGPGGVLEAFDVAMLYRGISHKKRPSP